jgi:RHS repeat-associated protein
MKISRKLVVCTLPIVLIFSLLAGPSFGSIQGDMNNDDAVTLADAVLIMKFLSKMSLPDPLDKEAGVGNDQKIGLDDLIYVLQVVSSFRRQGPNSPPTASFSLSVENGDAPLRVVFDASASSDPEGAIIDYLWDFGDGHGGSGVSVEHLYGDPGTYKCTLTVIDDGGAWAVFSRWVAVTGQTEPPPDPATVAPELDMTVATNLKTATEFLYTGVNPIQEGVIPDKIEPVRVAILRGKVTGRDGEALPGVRIRVLDHPEFGQTLTREDGMFDLAVNGGTLLTLTYSKADYLTAQRQVDVPWREWVTAPDVILVQVDERVTAMDSMSPVWQVAQGDPVTDEDGTRQATLMMPPNTAASMVLPDGTVQSITTMNVRATEYTVGPDGPKAMPAELPPQVAYTYCVEMTADEALEVGATEVRFNQPVYIYVEDFIGFSVGSAVPSGYYDRKKGQWIPSENGRVIKILSITGGKAELDTDGNSLVDDETTLAALNITDAERQKLAGLYTSGQSLWRVPVKHFTPWDCNWPNGPPMDAEPPRRPDPKTRHKDNPCEKSGSIIECENQTLGESIPIAGTPFSLNYRSDRVPERAEAIDISLSGGSMPASLEDIRLEIDVAGKRFSQDFRPQPNLSYTFTWDGKDAYGRELNGGQPITVRIGYQYRAQYYAIPADFSLSFARLPTVSIGQVAARESFHIWQSWKGVIGSWEAQSQGLGAWSLNIHHAYDMEGRTLFRGDGSRQRAETISKFTIRNVAGGGSKPAAVGTHATEAWFSSGIRGIAVTSDGKLYFRTRDSTFQLLIHVNTSGIIEQIEAIGWSKDPGIDNLIAGPDDYLYYTTGCAVWKYDTNSRYRYRVAGTANCTSTLKEGPATSCYLYLPEGLAFGEDGSLYVYDQYRIVQVTPDGYLRTISSAQGCNVWYWPCGDDGFASNAGVTLKGTLAMGPDGVLYLSGGYPSNYPPMRIRAIKPDGIICTVAGVTEYYPLQQCDRSGGMPATDAKLCRPYGVVATTEGFYFYDGVPEAYQVRHVGNDGIMSTIAGGGNPADGLGDNGPATAAKLLGGSYGNYLSAGPDASLYVQDGFRIRRIESVMPGLSLTDFLVPSTDGTEAYYFTKDGKHIRTVDSWTGAMLLQFTYDMNGLLTKIVDAEGNTTTIERHADGTPNAIVAPFGQRTTLAVNSNGYLSSITNPAGENTSFTYTEDGLLTSLTDPEGFVYTFAYEHNNGRLVQHEDPSGGIQTLSSTELTNGYEVAVTTAENRTTTYRVEALSTGDSKRTVVGPNGAATEAVFETNGKTTILLPDGTTAALTLGPDSRFGMQSPIISNLQIMSPGGLKQELTISQTSTWDPNDPLVLQSLTENLSLNGQIYSKAFDSEMSALIEATPEGRRMTHNLDAQGRIIGMGIEGLYPYAFTYDEKGRLETIEQGAGDDLRILSVHYNDSGFIDRLENPLWQTQLFEHDLTGRFTKRTFPDGRELIVGYDARGDVASVIPPGKPQHSFEYTETNLLRRYAAPDVGPESSETIYSYDGDKNITRIQRPDLGLLDYGYDAAGRLVSLDFPNATLSYSYQDGTGGCCEYFSDPVSITRANKGGGSAETLNLTYDGWLPTSTIWSGTVSGRTDYTYNNDFNILSEQVNGGSSIVYQYDNDQLVTGAGDLEIVRSSQNALILETTLSDVSTTIAYNDFGEVVHETAAAQSGSFYDVQYTRDGLGRITRKIETVLGATNTYDYGYDVNRRLVEVKKNGATVAAYTYDGNGNRLSVTAGGTTISAIYDGQDRLLQNGTTTYSYTGNGELLRKQETGKTTDYTYDALDNLLSVTFSDTTPSIHYVVDGRSRRVGKKADGVLVQAFLYKDQINPVAELDESGNITARFVYATKPNVPDYMIKGSVIYRIISDHLGSPRIVMDSATGEIAQRIDYDAWGRVVADSAPGFQPFGFAGGIHDIHTGLVRFGARDYDPEIGRWVTKDPRGLAAGTNVYAYVGADPINRIDPEGLDWLDSVGDFFAGFGDTLTTIPFTKFSLTRWIRKKLDVDDVVDPCSNANKIGQLAGIAVNLSKGYVKGWDMYTKPLYPSAAVPKLPNPAFGPNPSYWNY